MNEASINIIKHGMKKYKHYRHIAIYKELDNTSYFVCIEGYDDNEHCATIFGVENVSVCNLLKVIHDMEAVI